MTDAEWAAELRAINALNLQCEFRRWQRARGYDPTPEQRALLARCRAICAAGAGHAPLRKAGVREQGARREDEERSLPCCGD